MCWNIRWLDWYFVCGIWSSFLNTTQHRRREVVGKIQKHSLFEILALCLNRPVQNIYEAHISLIFKRLTMWSKSVGKKYLKCLDKYCIIWSHKWCQDVTRFLLNKWKITESMPPPPTTHIRSKYSTWANTTTDLEIYKGVWTRSWAIGAHLFLPTQADFSSLSPSAEWRQVSIFTLSMWQPLKRVLLGSYCLFPPLCLWWFLQTVTVGKVY